MKNILLNFYNKFEDNKFKVLILTLFFVFVVLIRFFLEIFLSSWYYPGFFNFVNFIDRIGFLFFHWFFWYLSAFLILFLVFKYFLKININKIVYLFLASLVILTPMIYTLFSGVSIDLVYLDFSNIKESIFNIFTLFYFDKQNQVFFVEMLFIIFGSFFLSYFFSRNILKSIINSLIIYFFIGLLSGFVYICPSSYCLIHVKSNLGGPYLLFYWIVVSFLLGLALMFEYFLDFLKNIRSLNLRFIVFYLLTLFLIIFISNFKFHNFFDLFLISFVYSIFLFTLFFIFKYKKNEKYFQIISFFIIYDLFIFLSLLLYFVYLFINF